MKRIHVLLILTLSLVATLAAAQERPANYARAPRFKALVYYSENAEDAHVQFSRQGVEFFRKLTVGEGFYLDVTTSLSDYPYEKLKEYTCVIMLDDAPHGPAERVAFEQYMENGGGWIGFHASGYNDRSTRWPWFSRFLGCGVFKCNNWPPQQALADVDLPDHPVTKNLPGSFVLPASEFYQWEEDLRVKDHIRVLLGIMVTSGAGLICILLRRKKH